MILWYLWRCCATYFFNARDWQASHLQRKPEYCITTQSNSIDSTNKTNTMMAGSVPIRTNDSSNNPAESRHHLSNTTVML